MPRNYKNTGKVGLIDNIFLLSSYKFIIREIRDLNLSYK